MSSIAFLHYDTLSPAERKRAVEIMSLTARYRGPDFIKEYHDGQVSMACAGLDLKDGSSQYDYGYEDGDYAIAFDGSLHNKNEVKEQLLHLNHKFKTESDAEILLRAYEEWGIDCLNRFNGKWAFVIYDKLRRSLLAARDRFGIKPIYYVVGADFCAIGSEVKQLLPFVENELDEETNFAYLNYGYTDYSHKTMISGIHSLRPSEYMVHKLGQGSVEKAYYYSIERTEKSLSEEEFIDLVDSSVRLRKREKYSTALTLSGGLDSSIIAYHLSQGNKRLVHAFTSIFSWWEEDEREKAMQSAAFYGLRYFTEEAQWTAMKSELGKVSYYHDQPLPSFASYSSFKLYELIAKYRIKVALNGQGMDELFAGYDSYYVHYLAHLFKKNPFKAIGEMRSGLGSSQYNPLALFKRSVQYLGEKKKPWVKLDISTSEEMPPIPDLPFLSSLAYRAIYGHSLSSMLHSVDRNSMLHSVDSRMPFLDYRLVEYALNAPDNLKIKNARRKYLVRQAYQPFLPSHVDRNLVKQGYATPQDMLMQRDKEEILNQIKDLQAFLPDWVDRKLLLADSSMQKDMKFLWRIWSWLRWREFGHDFSV